jgi:hypothetical protein
MAQLAATPPSRIDGFDVAPGAGTSREAVESEEFLRPYSVDGVWGGIVQMLQASQIYSNREVARRTDRD